MPKATQEAGTGRLCPMIAFDQIVGGKYKLRILWELTRGRKRYGELRRSVFVACQGRPVTPRILSRELRELAGRGLIDRKQYPVIPPKVEYSLTDLGKRLIPILDTIVRWGRTGVHEVVLQKKPSVIEDYPASLTSSTHGSIHRR